MFNAIAATKIAESEKPALVAIVQAKTRAGAIEAMEQNYRQMEEVPPNAQLDTQIVIDCPTLEECEAYYDALMKRLKDGGNDNA